MGLRPILLVLATVAACIAVAGASASAPPGATAQCRDGTYSFAVHHQGACSHHGGVAAWLDGGSSASGTSVDLGRTVVLRARTRTAGCALGADPDRRCSPGAYYSRLTTPVICAAGFRTSAIRNVSDGMRHTVEIEYGLAPRAYGRTLEIDHIVPLELGGSNDIANLYPERAPGYHTKDQLENVLRARVCSGAMQLRVAQAGIASNWRGLYREVFGASP